MIVNKSNQTHTHFMIRNVQLLEAQAVEASSIEFDRSLINEDSLRRGSFKAPSPLLKPRSFFLHSTCSIAHLRSQSL